MSYLSLILKKKNTVDLEYAIFILPGGISKKIGWLVQISGVWLNRGTGQLLLFKQRLNHLQIYPSNYTVIINQCNFWVQFLLVIEETLS